MVAPLDWGLGHTTRCVPLMQHILESGYKVLFAGNEAQRTYISDTFPHMDTVHLDGYNVKYAKSGAGFMWGLAKQLPGIINTVKQEHSWLTNSINKYDIDAVISDNRYGLYNKNAPSVIMTHQVQPISGLGQLADMQVSKLHNKYLQKFDECWVVDDKGEKSLAGKLSDVQPGKQNVKHLGLLSQLELKESNKSNYLMALLSGPEPQRSLLAEKLWQQLQSYNGQVVFVSGSKEAFQPDVIPEHIEYYDRINKNELEPLLSDAELVICRSGYSTIMDLVKLEKKAILIPTPGQTEQEYLAKKMLDDGVFLSSTQNAFDLQILLKLVEGFPFRSLSRQSSFSLHRSVLDDWLNCI